MLQKLKWAYVWRWRWEVMGRRRDEAEECAWEMRVPMNSECFGIEHACQVEMVLEGPDGSELETCSRILLVQRLPLGSRPNTHV